MSAHGLIIIIMTRCVYVTPTPWFDDPYLPFVVNSHKIMSLSFLSRLEWNRQWLTFFFFLGGGVEV